ncbi:hypothetical protein [Cellulomonas cellasea]|uniref:DUF4034 domain-containing protein n=1 Tax=Cellulomonas cellasea TaxID=43670 RepID=A0A7W4YCX3_9CELL|nr:hypothetical protein [Cellulomonas cellasea]MBB2924594.1 hypothetical protein [Cellulomonas cellasea]
MDLDSVAGTVLIGALALALIGSLTYAVAGSRAAFLLGVREEAPWWFRRAGARTQGLVVAYAGAAVAVGALASLGVSAVLDDARTLSWTAGWVSAVLVVAATMNRFGPLVVKVASDGRGTWDEPEEADFVEPDDALDDVDVRAAREAALAGDWRPAAHLLAATTDHDARYRRVSVLANAALWRSSWLDAWLRDDPRDQHALAVRAQLAVGRAWEIRGGEWTPKSPDRFLDALADAEGCAREAIAVTPSDPSPHVSLLTAARGQQVDRDEFDRRLAGLLAVAPDHLEGHEAALQYKAAKWFGSADEMFAFAREASARATPGTALALLVVVAHVEHVLMLTSRSPKLANKHAENPATRAEIAAAEARWRGPDGPSPVGRSRAHNLLAFAWWLAEDADAAREHLAHTREHLSSWPWEYADEPTTVHAQVQAWARARTGPTADGAAHSVGKGSGAR